MVCSATVWRPETDTCLSQRLLPLAVEALSRHAVPSILICLEVWDYTEETPASAMMYSQGR
jgi:hypothetical protein